MVGVPAPQGPACLGDLVVSVVIFCLGVLLLPPALVGFSHHLVTMGSDLPPVLGVVTWFTPAACLFSCPLPGGGLLAMDCSVLLFSVCVCTHIFIYAYAETHIQIQAWISQLSPSLPLTD